MNYDKLIQNINPPDSTAPFRLWDEVGYIVPWQDIKNIVKNGSDVNFDTYWNGFLWFVIDGEIRLKEQH